MELKEPYSDVNQKGLVFNIQRFSVNDDPGIRTIVFFKWMPFTVQMVLQSGITAIIPNCYV